MEHTWNTHVEEISKKISRTIGVLKKLQLTMPKNILLSIYNALILPQINYCLLCWGYDSSATFLLQKKAIRIISGGNIKSHTEPIFKLYNLLKIADIYKSKLLILYYKMLSSHLQDISTPSFLKMQQASLDIQFEILDGSLLLADIHILRALADVN